MAESNIRAIYRRIIPSSPTVLLVAFLFQVLFWVTVRNFNVSWPEASGPPLRANAAWRAGQHYAVSIEAALAALERSNPDKVAYLRSRGIPIYVLTPVEMDASCPHGSLGCTRKADSSINVRSTVTGSPLATAAVLSHEITHAQFHDEALGRTTPTLLTRLFGRGEEATAHIEGLRTAAALHVPWSSGPLVAWPLEYLTWYWPFGTVAVTGIVSALALAKIWRDASAAARRVRENNSM